MRRISFPSKFTHLLSSSTSTLSLFTSASPISTGIDAADSTNSAFGTLLDAAENKRIGYAILNRKGGKAYQQNQQLWSSVQDLEVDLTRSSFSPAERLPPELLPRDVAKLQLSGNIETAQPFLMKQKSGGEKTATTKTMLLEQEQEQKEIQEETENIDFDSLQEMQFATLLSSPSKSKNKQQHQQQEEKNKILEDITTNNTTAVASWEAVGLDPLMQELSLRYVGKGVTASQSRLIPALTNEDHNDVIFGSITGSGKTVAMLLAMMQGIRNETGGLNIFIASDSVNAFRAASFCKKFGAKVVVDDISQNENENENEIEGDEDKEFVTYSNKKSQWLYVADRRENFEMYFRDLSRSLSNSTPTRMLICTADVLSELLFEKKLEFGPFGNLRRLYVDDIGKDIRFTPKDAEIELKQEEVRNPSATQLMLMTVHQLMPAPFRGLLQIACVSADMESDLSNHLLSMCVKPTRHTLISCAARIPSTLHCVFSFYKPPSVHSSNLGRDLFSKNNNNITNLDSYGHDRLFDFKYLVTLLQNAEKAIPGRVLIFFPSDYDLLEVRAKLLRNFGMEAKLLFEVYRKHENNNNIENKNIEKENENSSSWENGWRFLLLHEHEGFGLDIPLVSHVVLTFCPSNRFSALHLCGRAGRAGNPGWIFTVVSRDEAKNINDIFSDELNVNVKNNTVDVNLDNVDESIVKRWISPPPMWMMDPRHVVERRYEKLEDANADITRATMFKHASTGRQFSDFQLEDYTPTEVLENRHDQIKKIKKDISLTPELAVEMSKEGLLDPNTLRPTKKLYEVLDRGEDVPTTTNNNKSRMTDEGRRKIDRRNERRAPFSKQTY